ncbi:MAG: hypothetical protein ACUVWN_13340 [bacterium]
MFSFLTMLMTVVELKSDKIGNVFTDNEPIKFYIRSDVESNITIRSSEGKVVFEDKIPAGERNLILSELSRNHYTIYVKSADEVREYRFGIIPSMKEQSMDYDTSIASDVAMSWLVSMEKFNDLAHLAKLTGIKWVRDRISWEEVEKQRNELADKTRYDISADVQNNYGLKVYQVFHATPGWAQIEKNSHSFPDDLRDAYNFAVQMARRFKGKVSAWEIWNEPDIIAFSDELGDSYSSLLKAMYIGFKSVDPEIPILICSFAMEPGIFAETIFQNDVGKYFDIYNYHIYDDWKHHSERALKHINLLKKYGLDSKPVWLTEAGRPIKREPKLFEMTDQQELDVANFLPKAIITSLSSGVDKYFWFILPYYRESDVMLFGLLRNDMTPTAGYCSFAVCSYALGKGNYIGSLDLSNIYAYVFERNDNEGVLAFWSDDTERTFRIQCNTDKATLLDFMGSESNVASCDGVLNLTASTSVKYLMFPHNAVSEKIKVDSPKAKSEIKKYDPKELSFMVLRLQFPKRARDKKSETYILQKDAINKVDVEVCNFSNNTFSGYLSVEFSEGWQGKINEPEINIQSMSRVLKTLEIQNTGKMDSERVPLKVNLMDKAGDLKTFIVCWVKL